MKKVEKDGVVKEIRDSIEADYIAAGWKPYKADKSDKKDIKKPVMDYGKNI